MNKEIERIIDLLKRTTDGYAWHGPDIRTVLDDVSLVQAVLRINGGHSIAELIHHITMWRIFAIKKLQGEDSFDITLESNFKRIESVSEEEWKELLDNLRHSQEALIHELSERNDSLLDEQVPGRSYNFYVLLQGIIQHDIYHLGQMVFLKKGS